MCYEVVADLSWNTKRSALLYLYKVSAAFRLMYSINNINKTIIIMVKQNLLTKLLLLFALIVGSTSVWAETKTGIDLRGSTTSLTFTDFSAAGSGYENGADKSLNFPADDGNSYGLWTGNYLMKESSKTSTALQMKSDNTTTNLVSPTILTNAGFTIKITYKSNGGNGPTIKIGTDDAQTMGKASSYKEVSFETDLVSAAITINAIPATTYIQKIIITPKEDDSKTPTTTTIDFSGISNTAVNEDTEAGTLTANVTADGTKIQGATVTWSSENVNVATINADGVVTLVAEGTTIITATYAGDDNYASSSDTYELTVTDSREVTGLAYIVATQTVTVGETLDAPSLTNPNNLTVTYSSDNTSVATVDANGNVTGVAVGSATITASFDGNDDYKQGNASYTIIVEKAVPTGYAFYESFDTNNGTGGNDGIWSNITATITATSDNEGWDLSGAFGADKCIRTNKAQSVTSPAIGISGNVILSFMMASWGGDTNEGYIDILNGGTFSDDSEGNLSNENTTLNISIEKSKWTTYTLKLENVTENTKIKFYNSTSGKRLFLDEVIIWTMPTATITDAGYATFSNKNALDFSANEDLTVYTATDNGKSVKLNEVTTKKVPANTPVVLKGEAGDYPAKIISSADALGDNDLCISDGTTATAEANIYVLANKSPNGVGFYKWAGTSSLSAGKIYLKAETSNNAPFLGFDGEGTTGINSVERGALSVEGCYTLDGRRVAQPTKGLYIVNGKKVVIK